MVIYSRRCNQQPPASTWMLSHGGVPPQLPSSLNNRWGNSPTTWDNKLLVEQFCWPYWHAMQLRNYPHYFNYLFMVVIEHKQSHNNIH